MKTLFWAIVAVILTATSPSFAVGRHSVMEYGSTCDTATVQAALNSGNEVIYIPTGTTCDVGALTISQPVTFQIEIGAVLRRIGAGGSPTITVSASNVTILGPGKLDNNSVGVFNDSTHGISATSVSDLTIRDLEITRTMSSCISIQTVNRLRIENNRLTRCSGPSIVNYFALGNVTDQYYIGNTIDRSDAAYDPTSLYAAILMYAGSSTTSASNVVARDNTVIGRNVGDGNGIEFLTGPGWPSFYDIEVSRNRVYGTYLAISVGDSLGITVSDNRITNPRSVGIEVGNSFVGVVSDNTIVGSGTQIGILGGGGYSNASVFTVTGNSIVGTTVAGIQVYGLASQWVISANAIQTNAGAGILFTNGGYYSVIQGNILDGATVGSVGISIGSNVHPLTITGNRVWRFGTAISGTNGSDKVCMNHSDQPVPSQNCP